MAGLYIHIPFCLSKCAYCGFYSIASLKRKEEFLNALQQEIIQRKDYLHGETIDTVYFGGGTPSILSIDELQPILETLHATFEINPQAEITLEANPDTLSLEYLESLHTLGINRLSIGIQSFFDNDLQYLSRKHNAAHARECVGLAKAAGFNNISLDLIYGLPTSDASQWNRNLDLFFEMDVPHLSAYALTLEPNAILTRQITQGKALPVNEEDAVRDYEILCHRAAENGFLHYEISNFCQPGRHSHHNASYWFGIPYAGFGPSAHSYDGASRQWNADALERYVENREPSEKETLSPEQQYDEYVMLRLRTMWGIDLKYIKREMGERFSTYCERQAQPLIAQGRLSQTREFLYLTDEQMLFADAIATSLMAPSI
ncbi:MAG: radical SAM family heme chaperone HemW [Bacteroidales bacterium]|nr:radical SAM family heme chaperone HemW [Bacteroidales bacterium]